MTVDIEWPAFPPGLDAGRWYQVAVSGEPTAEGRWRVRLYLDSVQVHEGTTQRLRAPLTLPPSAALGAEIFYFHDSYYRGLVGRTLGFDRPLWAADLRGLKPAD